MKSRKPFLLRMSPELYDALESWAQREMRSVNGQIEYILKEAVRRQGDRSVEAGDEARDDHSQSQE
jgi:hypothetical protein